METIKTIEQSVTEDKLMIDKTINDFHNLQTDTINSAESQICPSTRIGTEPDISPRQINDTKNELEASNSDAMGEEIQLPIAEDTKSLNIFEESLTKEENSITEFCRIQKRTIEELNGENSKLRNELDLLQREKSKSSVEAIKQVEEQLTKGLGEEKNLLNQKIETAYKELYDYKVQMKEEIEKKQNEIAHATTENKKMKEYIDTLIRTRADALKVVAMERMATNNNEFIMSWKIMHINTHN